MEHCRGRGQGVSSGDPGMHPQEVAWICHKAAISGGGCGDDIENSKSNILSLQPRLQSLGKGSFHVHMYMYGFIIFTESV